MNQKPFGVEDIDGVSILVAFDKSKADGLKQIIKTLSIASFKTSTTESSNLLDYLDEGIPLFMTSGEGYEIVITRKGVSLGFLDRAGGEYVFRTGPPKPFQGKKSELFTKDKMDVIDSDFNFILGLIFGKLGLATDQADIEFRLEIGKQGKFQHDFSRLLTPESKNLFGKISDLHVDGIRFRTEEEILGRKVKTEFRLFEQRSTLGDSLPLSLDCSTKLNFTTNIPINTFKLLEESLARLNNLVNSLLGGIIVNK